MLSSVKKPQILFIISSRVILCFVRILLLRVKPIRILSDNALILCEKTSAMIEIISIRKERMIIAKMNEGTGNRKKY